MSSSTPAVPIVCIGGVVADRVVTLDAPAVRGTSNPGSVVSSPGGVARNVAENLGRLGYRPSLVSVIGDDTIGTSLVSGVRAAGVDARGVRTVPTEPTAEYLAILEPDGELVLGVAVMSVHDALTEEDVDQAWPAAGWVILDCNPRSPVLEHAVAKARADDAVRLVVVAVSAPKIVRLPADLAGADMLFCTRDEARAWLAQHGSPLTSQAPDTEIAAAVRAAGARAIVLTLGAAGALGLDDDGPVEAAGAAVSVVDVTGGGDALVAGTVSALLDGACFADAVRRGVRLAGLTVAVRGAVRPDLPAADQEG